MSTKHPRRQLPGPMSGLDSPALAEVDVRSRSARLVSIATMAAARSKCDCDPCRLLRRAVDISMDEALKELQADAKSDDPPA